MERKFKRGDIYYANLNPVIGSEQGGTRPVHLPAYRCRYLFFVCMADHRYLSN